LKAALAIYTVNYRKIARVRCFTFITPLPAQLHPPGKLVYHTSHPVNPGKKMFKYLPFKDHSPVAY
jgi:hypothetical protein